MIPGSCIPDDDHNLISSTNINREIGQDQFLNNLTVRSAMLILFDTNKNVHQKSVTYTSMYLYQQGCPATVMLAPGEKMYSSYSLLTSALHGVSGQRQPLPRFALGERTSGSHCKGGWVGLRAGLDTEARGKILCLCPGSTSGSPVCSQTLYCLSCPSSRTFIGKCPSRGFSYSVFSQEYKRV
jgi:hypothetical protein